MTELEEFGERLKMYRNHKKLTLDKFGEFFGVGKGSVSQYESGKIRISTEHLFVIAKHFDLNLNWLFSGNGNMLIGESGQEGDIELVKKMSALQDRLIVLMEKKMESDTKLIKLLEQNQELERKLRDVG